MLAGIYSVWGDQSYLFRSLTRYLCMKRYGLNDLPQNSFYRELFKHCTYALDMPGNWMALGIRFEIRLLMVILKF